MKKTRLDLDRLTPPGMEIRRELTVYFVVLAVAFLINLSFPLLCRSAVKALYTDIRYPLPDGSYYITHDLRPGATMPRFLSILGPLPLAYLTVAILSLTFAAIHRSYLVLESRALYLLRRLPTRGETFRRVLLLPLLLVCLALAVALLHTCVNYLIYLKLTPIELRSATVLSLKGVLL